MIRIFTFFGILFFIFSCQPNQQQISFSYEGWEKVDLKYSTTFSIWNKGQSTIIELKEPYKDATTSFRYLILPDKDFGDNINLDHFDAVIMGNVESFVCTSTTHLASIAALGLSEAWTGFPQTSLVTSPALKERVISSKVKDLRAEMSLDIEATIQLAPQLIVGYTMGSNMATFEKLKGAKIPVVLNADFLETHPLGRAEYIKFFGALFQREEMADSIFTSIESNYLTLSEKVKGLEGPMVISGNMYNGTWYAPGGKSWAAKFLKDAGAGYIWAESTKTGSIEMDYETAYAQGNQADFWIGASSFESLDEVKNADGRYTQFSPFQNGNIYTYTLGKSDSGSYPYLEEGYLRADLVLSDLIAMLHPEVLPNHQFNYFKKLK